MTRILSFSATEALLIERFSNILGWMSFVVCLMFVNCLVKHSPFGFYRPLPFCDKFLSRLSISLLFLDIVFAFNPTLMNIAYWIWKVFSCCIKLLLLLTFDNVVITFVADDIVNFLCQVSGGCFLTNDRTAILWLAVLYSDLRLNRLYVDLLFTVNLVHSHKMISRNFES